MAGQLTKEVIEQILQHSKTAKSGSYIVQIVYEEEKSGTE